MRFFEGTAERLWKLPPRIRIRVPDINPETGGQRIDRTTGDRVSKHEDVNAVMYIGAVILMIPYLLLFLLWDEVRAAMSPSFRQRRDREGSEYVERARRRRERYRPK